MIYAAGPNSWQWNMDGEENGKPVPFARLVLTQQQVRSYNRRMLQEHARFR
jgi:hypothetical protein